VFIGDLRLLTRWIMTLGQTNMPIATSSTTDTGLGPVEQ